MARESERPGRLSRRRYIALVGAGTATTVGLAGCTGDGGDGGGDGGTPTPTDGDGGEHEEDLPEGVSEEEFEQGPVPSVYQEATSQGNEQRDPNDLQAKADVNFMESSEAVEQGLAAEGASCATCADFIPDKNGDGFGACAEVQGYIGEDDWCVVWESLEEEEEEEEEEQT